MQILNKVLGLSAGLVLAFGAATSAQAATTNNTSFYFDGTCADCTAPGGGSTTITGTLTLSNYTASESITFVNFVSFTYNGSNVVDPFTAESFGSGGPNEANFVSGSMSNVPGFNDFLVVFADGLYFQTNSEGGFILCASGPSGYYANACQAFQFGADSGRPANWNTQPRQNVPEPGSLALVGLAITALAIARRRRSL